MFTVIHDSSAPDSCERTAIKKACDETPFLNLDGVKFYHDFDGNPIVPILNGRVVEILVNGEPI